MEEENKRKRPTSSKPFGTRQSEEKKRKYQQAQLAKSGQRTSSSGNWYSGDRPTRRETLARVYQMGMEDPSKRERLMQLYDAEVSNPNSFLYNPYTKATSTKYTKTNINNTVAAQEEWARLSDELTYWAGRTDRNYSDDEIIGKINWDNYKTLQKMDAARSQGGALELLDAVGYSDDAMYGVLWAARNPNQSTGNAMYDAAKSALGVGNKWKGSSSPATYLDATSSGYAPYKAGATALDDLAYKYGITHDFDEEWLYGEGRSLLNGDEENKADYARIYDAVTNTNAYKADSKALYDHIQSKVAAGFSPEEIFTDDLFEDYPKAKELYESQKRGALKPTTSAIDFDMGAWYDEAYNTYQSRQGQLTSDEYTNDITGRLGMSDVTPPSEKPIKGQEKDRLRDTRSIFFSYATPEEQEVLQTYDETYEDTKQNILYGLTNGTTGGKEAYESAIDDADDYAAEFYLNSRKATKALEEELEAFEAYEDYREKWDGQLGEDPDGTNANAEYQKETADIQAAKEVWEKYNGDSTAIVEGLENEQAVQDKILRKYEDAELFNDGNESSASLLPVLDFIEQFEGYKLGDFRVPKYNWQAELDDGADWETVSKNLSDSVSSNVQYMKMLDVALEHAEAYGLPDDYVDGLEAARERLFAENKAAGYALLRNNDDFDSKVAAFDDGQEKYKQPIISFAWNKMSHADLVRYAIIDQESVINARTEGQDASVALSGHMTEDEKKTYKYLYMTEGEERATEYFDEIAPMLEVRGYQAVATEGGDIGNAGEFIGKNVASVLMNAGSVFALASNAVTSLSGEKLNPYSTSNWMTAYSGSVREGSKATIDETFKNQPVLKAFANFGYDAAMTGADSLTASVLGGGVGGLALMGASAGQSGLMDASMRGAEDWRAWLSAGASAAAEVVTEKLPMDKLGDIIKKGNVDGIKGLLKDIVAGIATDAPGEMLSELAGTFSDDLIMGELSNTNLQVQQLMAQYGLSEEAAYAEVAKGVLGNVLYSGLLSVGSTTVSSTGAFLIGSAFGKSAPAKNPVTARSANVLSQARKASTPQKAATVAGVMQGLGVEPEAANASAQKMVANDPDAADTVKTVITRSNDPAAAQAVAFGTMMPESETGKALEGIRKNGGDDESVVRFVETAKEEMSNPDMASQFDGRVAQTTEGVSTVAAAIGMEDGAYKAAQKAADDAKTAANDAKAAFDAAMAEEAAAQEERGRLMETFVANPSDEQAKNAVIAASDKCKEAQNKSIEASKAADAAKAAYEEAKAELETQKQNIVSAARTQGAEASAQKTAETQAARQQKAEEAEARRQRENIETLEAENFAAENHPGADQIELDEIIDAYRGSQSTVEKAAANIRFLAALGSKLGIEFEIVDNASFDGKYVGNKIILSKNTTQSDALKQTVTHELVHHIERTGEYQGLVAAVKEILFDGDEGKFRATVNSLFNAYKAEMVGMVERNELSQEEADAYNEADAEKDVVAEALSAILNSDPKFAERLVAEKPSVAQKILEALRNFINKLRGVNDPMMDSIRIAEKQFMRALESAGYDASVNSDSVTGAPIQNKFRLGRAVEETSNLIATHNLSFENLSSMVSLGGLPMICLAVVDAEIGHTTFGPISLMFGKDTIDPKKNKSNKLYGNDAYTPVVTGVGIRVDPKGWKDFLGKLSNMVSLDVAQEMRPYLKGSVGIIDEMLLKTGSVFDNGTTSFRKEDLISELSNSVEAKLAYLEANGMPDGLFETSGETGDRGKFVSEFEKKLDEAAKLEDVSSWIEKELEGVFGEKTITTYDETPLPFTIDNILDNLHNQIPYGAVTDLEKTWASAVKIYKSLREARKDLARLRVDSETAKKQYEAYGKLVEDVKNRVWAANMNRWNEGKIKDGATPEAVVVAAGKLRKNPLKVRTFLAKYGVRVDNATFKKIMELYNMAENIPAHYMESKPDRVIGFDELKFAVVPETMKARVEELFTKAGIGARVLAYKDGDDADRVSVMNSDAVASAKFSLPDRGILDKQIAVWKNNIGNQRRKQGQRQFAGKTVQESQAVPGEAKQEFTRPENLLYDIDTNREQVERGWKKIQQNGYQAEKERLLSLERFDADDTAEANLMMAMALREDSSDPDTFMSLALHYNKEGTKAGKELQARKLFSRMSPTGARVWVAGKSEQSTENFLIAHKPYEKKMRERADAVKEKLIGLQSGDEMKRLSETGSVTIGANNKWGIPINEQQEALISEYELENEARVGDIFYNRATIKQRMLEAILATPNPLQVTGAGLSLVERLEMMKDGHAVVTNADLNYIYTRLGEYMALGQESGGRDADVALARAYEAYGNITPASGWEKFRTQRYVNMLLNVPSFTRNIIGNAAQNAINAAAHGTAVLVDKAVAKKTGRRTVEHLDMNDRISGWNAFAEETMNTFRDFFVDKVDTSPNRDKFSTSRKGRVFQNRMQEGMRNLESFMMSVGDRNVWKKAYVNSLAEQQKLADRNLLKNDDGTTVTHEQMLERAERDANYATFTEEGFMQKLMGFIGKQKPELAEVISLYVPFSGVPTNIMKRSFQYSPIGFIKTFGMMGYRHMTKQNFNQQEFVNGIARSLTGTAMMVAGALLGAAGIIKLGTEDDESDKLYDVNTALGEQYTPYVYDPLTDTYVNLSTFAPAASPLIWGASVGEALKNDESKLNILLNAMYASTDSILSASYLSGISDIFGGYGSIAENFVQVGLENLVSQSIPSFVSQMANAMDAYVRDTEDKDFLVGLMKTTANKIPFLRNAVLPEKVMVTGESVETKSSFSYFVDPMSRTTPSENPALIEAKRLYDVFKDTSVLPSDALRGKENEISLKVDGKKMVAVLTDKQKEEYKKFYGDLWTASVNALMISDEYAGMDDGEKGKVFEDIMKAAMKEAKTEFLKKYGQKVD